MTDEPNFIIDDILGEGDDPLETEHMPTARAFKITARRRFHRVLQKQALQDVVKAAPAPGESIHLVSNAKFDFWTWVPALLDWIDRTESLYCSTWTLNRSNAVELFELWDQGRFGAVGFLTGLYFKRRETAVYTFLLDGIRAREGRYRASLNHAKVLLLDNPARGAWLTVEGSANLTANPRTEQYVITNDRGLWDFHRGWMEELLAAHAKEGR